MQNLLFSLCSKSNFSKVEDNLKNFITTEISKYAQTHIDQNGNIITKIKNPEATKTLLLDAHYDQIALMVTDIDKGYLRVANYGGIDARILPSLQVKIHCNDRDIDGIICSTPPHIKKDVSKIKIEDILIDTGLTEEKVKKLIQIGDMVTFSEKPKSLLDNKISAPALDNRVSVAILLQIAKVLSKQKLPYNLTFVFSHCEESTGAGAKTSAYASLADEAIVLDVSFADQPDIPNERCFKLSSGPIIGVSPTLSPDMYNKLMSIAKKNKIKYSIEPMPGKTSTNSDHISTTKDGIPTALISIPLRYMHTPVELVDISDLTNSAKLITKYILEGDDINE